jgi:hypothetical protein
MSKNSIMERASGELINKDLADPKDSEESPYAKEEERVAGFSNLRTSIEREAAYIRAYNRYLFGFDVRT